MLVHGVRMECDRILQVQWTFNDRDNAIICVNIVRCCLFGLTIFALVLSSFALPGVFVRRLVPVEEHRPSPSLLDAVKLIVLALRGTQRTPEVFCEIAEYLKFLTFVSADRLSLWMSADSPLQFNIIGRRFGILVHEKKMIWNCSLEVKRIGKTK